MTAGLQEEQEELQREKMSLEKELGEFRTALASLEVDLRTQIKDREINAIRLQDNLSELEEEKALAEAEISELKSTYYQLTTDLKKEIQKKEVTLMEFREKLSITFVDRILFESGRSKITGGGRTVLKKVGEILKDIDQKRIRVVGHTDNLPISKQFRFKFPSNWELSAARAAAVVRYFQKVSGIDPRSLEAVGSSYYQPIASNKTPKGRAQNRRVEIIIVPEWEG
jgi:chemotaxis protein MotB